MEVVLAVYARPGHLAKRDTGGYRVRARWDRLTHHDEYAILMIMPQRLQVLLDEAEFEEIRRIARRHRMTVAEWVRQALRLARTDEPYAEPRRKLAVVREAVQGAYPTADIDLMLAEIERGFLSGEP